jgi:branched-chain amino acid aminotransferase
MKEGNMAEVARADKIWKNGEMLDWESATTHILTHALHYGTAVFEGIRCYETERGSAVFRLQDHMTRLVQSARIIQMPLPYDADELASATLDLIRENKLPDCYIRPIAYRGYGHMGVDPLDAPIDVAIAVWPWPAYLGEGALEHGVDVGISTWRQRSINALPGGVKSSASYLNSALAHMEAAANGYDEAILLNEAGYIAEGSGENVFIVKDGRLITPEPADGILSGITRDSVMKLASESLGLETVEKSIARTELYLADEMFMTGTAAEITPVRSVDRREIGSPGPVTKEIQRRFFDVVSAKDDDFSSWLSFV